MKSLYSKIKNKVSYTLYIILFTIFCVVPQKVLGSSEYKPITPNFPLKATKGVDALFTELFRWSIGLIVILAVVMLVIGGIQYMGTESISGKSNGKEQIFAAIGGLLIALLSVLLLNIILGDGSGTSFTTSG